MKTFVVQKWGLRWLEWIFHSFQLVAVPHKVFRELAASPFKKNLANCLHNCTRER